MQASSRIDVYAMTVEDGEYIYVAGDAVNMSAQLLAGSLNLGGGGLDIYAAKLRRDGSPVYQAIIGGRADDTAYSVAVRQGVLYILGETWAGDFPGAPGNAGENDAVVLALSADGGSVLWARRFGGSDQDSGRAIIVSGNDLYLTGITWSIDFVAGSARGDADGFLGRLDRSGALQWMKVFGGAGLDAPFGLAAGDAGIWVTGETLSPNLAGEPLGEGDIFALRYGLDGARQFGALYGGAGEDIAYAAAPGPDGSLYLAGETQSAGLAGAAGQFSGATDALLMRLGADGTLQSTAYLGGAGQDSGMALAVLPNGDALIAGRTRSEDFPTSAAGLGGRDAFLAQVSPDGEVVYASRQGGPANDSLYGMGLTTDAVALAGSFSAGTPAYLLLVPKAGLPEIILPTAAPPQPTATTAPTATAQPTETAGPTITAQPMDAPVTAETEQPTGTAAPAANAQPAETLAGQAGDETQAAAAAEVAAATEVEATTASTTKLATAAPAEPGDTQAAGTQEVVERQNGRWGIWIASGLVLIAGFVWGVLRRRSKQRSQ
jgi:hypothetical protein